jgi:WG containing repeat
MRLRLWLSVLWLGPTLALTPSPSRPALALSSAAPPIGSRGAADQQQPTLPPAAEAALKAALAREALEKRIGVEQRSKFPLVVCGLRGKCALVHRDGTFALIPAYDWIDQFVDGRAVVRARHRYRYLYGYIDDTGRVISTPQFAVAGEFFRGFAQVDVEGQSGLIDRDGQVALWPRFGFVVPFTANLFWVTEERSVTRGNTGREKFSFELPSILVNGAVDADIKPKGHWGLVDRKGAWVRQPEFLDIRAFDGTDRDLMWAKTEAGWGLIRPDLSWQAEPRFEDVGPITDGFAPVALGARWGFVDTAGQIVIEPRFDRAYGFHGSYAVATMSNRYGLVDRSGAWVIEPQYDAIVPNILAPRTWWTIKSDRKFGLLDDALRVVVTPQLDRQAALCDDGRILGRVGQTWQMFLRDGTPLDDEQICDSLISTRQK